MNHLASRPRASSTSTTRWAALACLASVATLAAACSGSGDEGPAAGAPPNPDPLSSPALRNDCNENVFRLLASNVGDTTSWAGPRSRYREAPAGSPAGLAWSPLRASTSEASGGPTQEGNRVWSSTAGAEADRAACAPLLALLGRGRTGTFDTASYTEQALRLEHDVTDFRYPAGVDEALAATAGAAAPTEVGVRSTLTITFQKPRQLPDGTYDYSQLVYRDEDVQTWPLEDVVCDEAFTVAPEWRTVTAPGADFASSEPFCRDGANGTIECLEYAFKYTADQCRFTIRDGTFTFADGSPPLRANVAGHFDRYADSQGKPAGYEVHFTNFEIL